MNLPIKTLDEQPEISDKQARFILESTAKLNFAHGAVRAGKTWSSLFRFGEAVIRCPDDKIIMIGKSADSIFDNAVKPFALDDNAIYRGYCSWSPGKRILNFAGKDIRVIGANDQGAIGRIQGNTISVAYVDEMTILPQNFLDMLFTRLSLPHSILFGTMNPDTPFHPLKEMIDRADGKDIYALHFSLDDNPSLSSDYKEFLKKNYSGLWYKRYVLGEWVQAEGAVYESWNRNYHVVKRLTSPDQWIVGIDVGASNPFAAILIGINSNHHPAITVHKEYFWDPKKTGRSKTNAEFADDLDRFLYGYPIRCVYIDPAAESFEIELRKRKRVVKHAKNDVFNGISIVANYLSQGDLAVHESCQNLIREIEGYVWDPKKVKLGEDAPLKQNDHLCDALRYALASHFPNQNINPRIGEDPFKGSMVGKKPLNDGPFSGHGWQTFGGGGNTPPKR